jgi:hypothetical protein
LETLLLHGQAALLYLGYFAHFREPQQCARVYLYCIIDPKYCDIEVKCYY